MRHQKFEDFFFTRVMGCILVIGCFCNAQYSWAQVDQERLANFASTTQASISYNKSTGRPNFIRFPAQTGLKITAESAKEKCGAFIIAYGDVFGMSDPDRELVLVDEVADKYGTNHIIYQQYHRGVPVFDGQLKFHFDAAESLTAVNGLFVPGIKISTVPRLTADGVQKIAKEELKQQDPSSRSWLTREAKLYIYRKGLLRGEVGTNHLIYHVELNDGMDVREFFFIDAHTGEVIEQVSGIHGALHRRLYEVNTSNEIWTEGDGFPGGLDQWQQNEIAAAGQTYYFFYHAFGYDSYDGFGAEMRTINNDPNINCPNANWNGSTANYCTGSASDDIVGHEWGHAYTEYTSGLIYAWQSGALNESYSDIWGETIDLLNGYEDQGEDLTLRNSCGSSDRWRLGEDASAFGGAIRDMWDPTCNGDPGKVSDTEYWCSIFDQGGVHTNSGVHNHAYALLVDGGNYNGYTIEGLGFTKAAHIFWRAQHVYLTATSDFEVQADALEAACMDLMGIDLEGLSTSEVAAGPSGEIVDINDLVELQKVIAAVELRIAPSCAFDPLLAASSPLCLGATKDSAIFYEDFELGLGGWQVEELPVNIATWEERSWEVVGSLPNQRPGNAAFGVDPINGDCINDIESGILRLESPPIAIPAEVVGEIRLAFDHYISTETRWDGGNLKYSINGGTWQILPENAFVINGYSSILHTAAIGSDNPLAGEYAFTGSDEGSVSGSWGTSVIDLSNLVVPEHTLRLRWEMGTDGCNGRIGWYVDDVSIYNCQPCTSELLLAASRSSQEILFEAADQIITADTVLGHSQIHYSAGNAIELSQGFALDSGAVLEVIIDGCVE